MASAAPPSPPESSPPTASWVGDRYLRVAFGDVISMDVQERVWNACDQLSAAAISGVVDVTPAFTTLLVTFSQPPDSYELGMDRVLKAVLDVPFERRNVIQTVEVPVCYETEYAPDIEAVAQLNTMTSDEVARLHAGAEYTVACIGFMPGFPYLHGLPAQISAPRLASPRARVPAGSIGIAGMQSGIYPATVPGGWRLIGRTPLRLFDATANPPTLLKMRDRVKFVAISSERFRSLSERAEGA